MYYTFVINIIYKFCSGNSFLLKLLFTSLKICFEILSLTFCLSKDLTQIDIIYKMSYTNIFHWFNYQFG